MFRSSAWWRVQAAPLQSISKSSAKTQASVYTATRMLLDSTSVSLSPSMKISASLGMEYSAPHS